MNSRDNMTQYFNRKEEKVKIKMLNRSLIILLNNIMIRLHISSSHF